MTVVQRELVHGTTYVWSSGKVDVCLILVLWKTRSPTRALALPLHRVA